MKKTVFIFIILLVCCHCFGQEKAQPKSTFKYSAGIAYNQIWLQGNCYGTNEYGAVSSSPFNWGITPYFSMSKGKLMLSFGLNYLSFSRRKDFFTDDNKPSYDLDKWQEASLSSTVGFQVTGEHLWIKVTPFLGVDLSYLINYEKDVTMGSGIRHYNTDQLEARDYHDTHWWNDIPIPFGLDILGGINVSCPIARHFEIGISYCLKFKIINDIRNFTTAHNPDITSPVLYHNASIGVSYRFN